MTVVRDTIQTKPVPGIPGSKREDFDGVIGTWAQACHPGNQQIREGGVVVTPAALLSSLEPLPGRFVKILANIRMAIEAVAARVRQKRVKIILSRDDRLRIIAQHVCQSGERLGGGKRPYGPVPFARAATMGTELRMAALGGSNAERGMEALGVSELGPGGFVSSPRVGRWNIQGMKPIASRASERPPFERRTLKNPAALSHSSFWVRRLSSAALASNSRASPGLLAKRAMAPSALAFANM